MCLWKPHYLQPLGLTITRCVGFVLIILIPVKVARTDGNFSCLQQTVINSFGWVWVPQSSLMATVASLTFLSQNESTNKLGSQPLCLNWSLSLVFSCNSEAGDLLKCSLLQKQKGSKGGLMEKTACSECRWISQPSPIFLCYLADLLQFSIT